MKPVYLNGVRWERYPLPPPGHGVRLVARSREVEVWAERTRSRAKGTRVYVTALRRTDNSPNDPIDIDLPDYGGYRSNVGKAISHLSSLWLQIDPYRLEHMDVSDEGRLAFLRTGKDGAS